MACVAIVWLALDLVTKFYFNSGTFQVGQIIAGPFLGLFQFTLVHNTGAAWGIFSDSTQLLGAFSLVICALLLVYVFIINKTAALGEVFGLSLILAGGLGNAFDRFFTGYVVDFIEFTFIDFPVFNIADIGVTCGFVIFFIFLLLFGMRDDSEEDN